MPALLADPCVIRINKTAYLIASHQVYMDISTWFTSYLKNNSIILIYNFEFNRWIDISGGFPCPNLKEERITCAGSNGSFIIIPNAVCTAILDLSNLGWIKMKENDESLLENPRNNVIFNPISNRNDVILISGRNVFKLKWSKSVFKWEFQYQMRYEINSNSFVSPSKLVFLL